MWENSPVFSPVLCLLYIKLKARILVFNVGVKIVVTCFNSRQPHVHVRSHDQLA